MKPIHTSQAQNDVQFPMLVAMNPWTRNTLSLELAKAEPNAMGKDENGVMKYLSGVLITIDQAIENYRLKLIYSDGYEELL